MAPNYRVLDIKMESEKNPVKLLCYVTWTAKSDDDIIFFHGNPLKVCLKWERFFKKKFKQKIYHGAEYFKFDSDDINRVKRLFSAIARSEENAFMLCSYTQCG